ncbi:unnamed protein product [Caenorhabditis angaria]|uniref:CHK kinase-like domain-containing protein n=1 Tax=Caenorhabditis angaria TaxID=860376 RepID=A0A9P1IM40_9PELO|nr:unnamed protein product [Caenorhabditis angaria]
MPTLLEKGEGLAETHVFLEDIQQVLSRKFGANAKLDGSTKYTVIGDGNGFLSKVLLIEPNWNEEGLPKKFVLKIASAVHIASISEKMKETGMVFPPEIEKKMWEKFENESKHFHNREVHVYQIFEKWNIPNILLNPKVYFSQEFDEENTLKGFIGMEFAENAEIRHIYCNVEPESLYPVLKSIANFQVKSLTISESDRESISGFNYKEMMKETQNDETLKGMFLGVKNIDEKRLAEKCEKLAEIGSALLDLELPEHLNEIEGIKQDVMVHGDLWAANIIWRKTGENEYEVNKLLDYQLVHFGNPAEDLVRLFLSTLSGKDFNENWEKLVEKFYEYFLEAFNSENHGTSEIPFSLKQLKSSFDRFFLLAAFFMLPMFGPIAQTKLAKVGNDDINEDERLKIKEILAEKSDVLLDNMIKHYEMYKTI